MTADDIKALVKRLRGIAEYKASPFANRYQKQAQGPEIDAADALDALQSQVETLALENQWLRVDAEKLKGPQHWNPIYNTDPVQRACGELPDGVEIEILLENGSGTVYLVDNNCGERTMIEDCDAFNWTVHKAIDAALSQKKEKPYG